MMAQRQLTLPEIEAAVRSFVASSYLSAAQAESFQNDDDLLSLLDSLQILRMIINLESTFSIKVGNSDLTPENLGSVERVAELIARKRLESPQAPRTCSAPAPAETSQ